MEWMRSREQMLAGPPAPNALRPSAASGPGGGGTIEMKKESVPKFVLVDANNRVRELTGGAAAAAAMGQQHQQQYNQQHNQQISSGGLSASSFTSLSFGANSKPISMSMPMAMHGHSYHHSHNSYNQRAHHNNDEDFAMTQEELDEQAQLEQQLQVQKEEMRFVSPLPRPQLHGNSSSQRPLLFPNHAYTYSDPNSSQQQFANPLKTPPTVPPVSPFAGLALSAPAKSTIASTGGKLPNPFHSGLSTAVESSPRLPSLNMFRAGSPGQLKMGIAAPRPPPLSLRSSSSDSFTTGSLSSHPSPSPHSTSFSFQSLSVNASPHRHVASSPSPSPMYSQSLPSSTFMHSHEMRKARMSFDGAESVNMSSDDEENGMMLLSSSVERATGGARTGRVCRYADCNNIARSRGLCRTHGGGKRCSHPNCNKSAQANRKCIAHGGGTPCSYGDCEKTAQSRGLCKAHGGGARCKHPDCPKSSQSKGLCRGHGGGIKCKEDGCEKWVQKNGYCIKHGRERSMTS